MKLVASLTSPFARKIRILLREKGLPFELVVDIPWNDDTHVPDYNPLGKVPVLLRDDGRPLYDSRVIAAWLETQPGRRFVPGDDEARIEVLRLEALSDGVAEAAAAIFIERRRPAALISEDWTDRQLDKILRGLDSLAATLGDRSWLAGEVMTLADIAAVCALGYLDFRFPEIDWRARQPALERLATVMEGMASVRDTRPAA